MTSLSIAAKVTLDGTVTIPRDAVGALGLQPGDDVRVQIETVDLDSEADGAIQSELHRKLLKRLEDASRTVREPFKALSDPLEAEWARGVEEKARRMGLKI